MSGRADPAALSPPESSRQIRRAWCSLWSSSPFCGWRVEVRRRPSGLAGLVREVGGQYEAGGVKPATGLGQWGDDHRPHPDDVRAAGESRL
jgi:hypothetical protein